MCCASGASHGSSKCVLDHLEQRPHRALGQPRVRVGLGAGRHAPGRRRPASRGTGSRCWRRRRRAARASRRGAPTAAASASARCRGSAPRRPRAPWGRRAARPPDLGQHRDQRVGPLGSVDVQHPGRVRRRCSRADRAGTASGWEAVAGVRRAGAGAALGQRHDGRLPELVVGQLGLIGLEMAGRLLDRGELGDLARLHPHDAEAGELAGRDRAPRDSKEPTALL